MTERVRVAILGSGFAGLARASKLREAGCDDCVVLEKAHAIGGTWRDNHYPGCACDVPAHLYSYSFAPNPDWSEAFAPQPEIRAYIERVSAQHGLRPFVRFGAGDPKLVLITNGCVTPTSGSHPLAVGEPKTLPLPPILLNSAP